MGRTSIELKMSTEDRAYIEKIKAAGDKGAFYDAVKQFFDRQGIIIAGRISRGMGSGNGLWRSGALAKSMWGWGEIYGGVPAIRVGSLRGPALKYVAVQEYGTVGAGGELPTIVPKALMVKNLAIPLDAALTPSGIPKKPRPQDWGPLKYIPFKNRASQNAQGALFTPEEYAKIKAAIKAKTFSGLKNYQALYLLVRKTDIKPKRFLRDGFAAYLPELTTQLSAFIKAYFFSRQPVRTLTA